MHRQSLGSPSPKLPMLETLVTDEDDAPKPHRLSLSPPPPPPHKFVHLIPVLTLLCFFVLYLFSHTPSPSGTTHSPPLLLHTFRISLNLSPRSFRFRLESFHRIQPLAITPSRYRNRNAFRNSFLFLNYYFLFERVFRSVFFMLDLAEKIGGDIGQYMDVKRSDVLAIRSLQQIPKPRPHRKLADF
ncbi:hypothetical protein JHK82_025738 [Glycine max]|uniref:Uncharacterized protein n=1 Tax=Glycine max TaxID=3847 RepID=K7LF34_SOYBN|nr:hypothetical protein JHK85_026352 [Glycine max]KAG5134550.1 hypothetical protein JHK82_025738 [Glycine max]